MWGLLALFFLGKSFRGGFRGKLPRALPSHPLSRELSREESLEDTEPQHGLRRKCGFSLPHSSPLGKAKARRSLRTRRKCGSSLPYFSLVKVFAEGVRGRSLFQKASSPKEFPPKKVRSPTLRSMWRMPDRAQMPRLSVR